MEDTLEQHLEMRPLSFQESKLLRRVFSISLRSVANPITTLKREYSKFKEE